VYGGGGIAPLPGLDSMTVLEFFIFSLNSLVVYDVGEFPFSPNHELLSFLSSDILYLII